ncbi:hypothetical protein [Pseudomonas monteilii]|uniref:hypothetical protein n=1 Tax=Pseudomonas monteilii TaxID=76759 RepID=UPI001F2909A4|nr:hypothetical protein [Pseudomonas monteilii]
MNTPVETQILDLIEDRLKQISKANGFFTDDVRVERASLTPFAGKDLPAVNYWGTGDQLIESTGYVELRELEILVEIYDRHRDMSLTDKANQLAADVRVALSRDPTEPNKISPKLGRAVESLSVRTAIPAIAEGKSPYCGSVLTLAVRYRVDARNPFALIR